LKFLITFEPEAAMKHKPLSDVLQVLVEDRMIMFGSYSQQFSII
jgi:hypothetical protein